MYTRRSTHRGVYREVYIGRYTWGIQGGVHRAERCFFSLRKERETSAQRGASLPKVVKDRVIPLGETSPTRVYIPVSLLGLVLPLSPRWVIPWSKAGFCLSDNKVD